jgi:hypothetical protein
LISYKKLVSKKILIFMSISTRNGPQLGWGTLHYGIRASGSNTRLVWAKNQCELGKFVVTDFVCVNLGKKEKLERNPQIHEKI